MLGGGQPKKKYLVILVFLVFLVFFKRKAVLRYFEIKPDYVIIFTSHKYLFPLLP